MKVFGTFPPELEEAIEDISYDQWVELIDQWTIGENAERDRNILKRKLLDGLTFDDLAEETCMSVQQLKKIVKQRRTRIYAHIPGL